MAQLKKKITKGNGDDRVVMVFMKQERMGSGNNRPDAGESDSIPQQIRRVD